MNKKIKILLIISGTILIVFCMIYSFKLYIENYVILFSSNEKINNELNIEGDSLILILKTERWRDTSRNFEILYIEPYFQIKYKKVYYDDLDYEVSNIIEEHNATGRIFLSSFLVLLLYLGIIYIIVNNKYTKEQINRNNT